MSRKFIPLDACWALVLVCASMPQAVAQTIRQPLGVYAHVSIEDLLNANPPPSHADLRRLYAQVLADPAIAGLTVGRHWDNIQLSDPACVITQSCAPGTVGGYDWSYVDDAFVEATAAQKSVQLIITPGFDLPPWLAAKIPPCDGLFTVGIVIVPPDCGTVQFQHFPEDQRSDQINGHFVLPLPWNPVYQTAWCDFLWHLSARYNSNPTFIAIAIAEPVGGSTEFVLPTSDNNDGKGNGNSSQDPSGTPADQTWASLIAFSFPNATYDYQNSDQVLIDQWKQTIDEYETIFSGVTLFLSPDAGRRLPQIRVEYDPAISPRQHAVRYRLLESHHAQVRRLQVLRSQDRRSVVLRHRRWSQCKGHAGRWHDRFELHQHWRHWRSWREGAHRAFASVTWRGRIR